MSQINFSTSNSKAILAKLPLKKMNGHEKFLALAVVICKGKTDQELSDKIINKNWPKSIFKIKFNPSQHGRAETEGWINPSEINKGGFLVSQKGIDHLIALTGFDDDIDIKEIKRVGALLIVNRKATFSFDKFLRGIISKAKNDIKIADSWVDGSIFPNILGTVSKNVPMKLLYATRKKKEFEQIAKRFQKQYQKFEFKKYKYLHDRFIIIDDVGYVLGPSIKDAADKSPAIIVALNKEETSLLADFFKSLWNPKKAK